MTSGKKAGAATQKVPASCVRQKVAGQDAFREKGQTGLRGVKKRRKGKAAERGKRLEEQRGGSTKDPR